jgi:hypothetical protein
MPHPTAFAGRGPVTHVGSFAVRAHKENATLDPMDVDQWEFYVLPTTVLNEKVPTQKAIRLRIIGASSDITPIEPQRAQPPPPTPRIGIFASVRDEVGSRQACPRVHGLLRS